MILIKAYVWDNPETCTCINKNIHQGRKIKNQWTIYYHIFAAYKIYLHWQIVHKLDIYRIRKSIARWSRRCQSDSDELLAVYKNNKMSAAFKLNPLYYSYCICMMITPPPFMTPTAPILSPRLRFPMLSIIGTDTVTYDIAQVHGSRATLSLRKVNLARIGWFIIEMNQLLWFGEMNSLV